MNDIVTNLLGEIIEISEWANGTWQLKCRGTVRALYTSEKWGPTAVIEDLGSYYGVGCLAAHSLLENRVRPVTKCDSCFSYDHKSNLTTDTGHTNWIWRHLDGVGCRTKKQKDAPCPPGFFCTHEILCPGAKR